MEKSAFIYDAVRTPRGIGKKNGSLYEVKPIDLLSGLLKSLENRNELDTARVNDVVIGCNAPIGDQGSNIARTGAMKAGWDHSVCGVQMERFCGSALESVATAASKIMSGWVDLAVAGGVESMSRVPMGSMGGAWSEDPATSIATNFVPQGISADLIATIEGFTREDVDSFAVNSQRKAATAQEKGYFNHSIIPVKDENGITILDRDEFIRPDTTVEGLSKLKPSFAAMGDMGYDAVALSSYPQVPQINHVHHAGNSSGIVDAASAVLIGSEQVGKDLCLSPRARFVASATMGVEPTIMLTGPGPATQKVLDIAGMTIDQIDLFEVNEAWGILWEPPALYCWEPFWMNWSAGI